MSETNTLLSNSIYPSTPKVLLRDKTNALILGEVVPHYVYFSIIVAIDNTTLTTSLGFNTSFLANVKGPCQIK